MAETRENILRAATELFAEHGYSRTSIRQVAERADANSALIYYYFGNKAELFQEAMGEPSRRLREMLERALASPGPAADRLERFLDEYVPFALHRIPLTALVFRSLSGGDQELAAMIGREFAPNLVLLRRILEEGVQRGELRPMDTRLAAGSLLGMVLFYVLAAPLTEQALEIDTGEDFPGRLARHTLTLFLGGAGTGG